MSADNTIAIRNTENGRFAVNMEFLSCEYPIFADAKSSTATFKRLEDANKYADDWYCQWSDDGIYVEYGVSDYTSLSVDPTVCACGDPDCREIDDPYFDDQSYDYYNEYYDEDDYRNAYWDDPYDDYEDSYQIIVREVDPELERLLAEEEEIERSIRSYHSKDANYPFGKDW